MRSRLNGWHRGTRCAVVFAIAGVAGLASPFAWANDSVLGTQAGTPIPIENHTVRMDSEAVQVLCLDTCALYRVDFKFVNEASGEQRVTLGFPFSNQVSTNDFGTGDTPAGFRAWFNGQELEVTPRVGEDTYGGTAWPVTWYAHEVAFPPGESMVTVSYAGSPDLTFGDETFAANVGGDLKPQHGMVGLGSYPYQVHTGAGWKGPIRKSVIRYVLSEDFGGVGVPQTTRKVATEWIEDSARRANVAGFSTPSEDLIEWTFEDYEPDASHDTEIWFVVPGGPAGEMCPWTTARWSSEVRGEDGYEPASAATDAWFSTSWVEAVRGAGIGEWIDITCDKPRQVREIRVWPGDQQDAQAFVANNRPRTLLVEFSDGTSSVLRLKDEIGVQRFSVDVTARSARVTILDAYEGSNGLQRTHLTEIAFSEAPSPEFDSFESVTGIDPPKGHADHQVLLPVTETEDWDDIKADYAGLQSEAEREAKRRDAETARRRAAAKRDEPITAIIVPAPAPATLGLLALASLLFVGLAAALGSRVSRALG